MIGNLDPVISYPDLLPNSEFWVKDISEYNFTDFLDEKVITYTGKKKKKINWYYVLVIISCILAFLVGYFYKGKKRGSRK